MNEVIRVSDKTKEKMIEYYKDKKKDKEIPYVVFQAVDMDTTITMYTSGKVMFQERVLMLMLLCGKKWME